MHVEPGSWLYQYLPLKPHSGDYRKIQRRLLKSEKLERGGLLLTVETDVNRDSKSTNERGTLKGVHLKSERLERGPLLTVETVVNGDSKSTNKRGRSFLGWFVGLVVPVQEILFLPWLL